MDELNHRGTRFPVDEDTNNFYIKEERGQKDRFNGLDILKIIKVISGM